MKRLTKFFIFITLAVAIGGTILPMLLFFGNPSVHISDMEVAKSLTPDYPSEIAPFDPWSNGSNIKNNKLRCDLKYTDKFLLTYEGVLPGLLDSHFPNTAVFPPKPLDAFYIEGTHYKAFIGQQKIRYQLLGRHTVSLNFTSNTPVNDLINKFETCGYDELE